MNLHFQQYGSGFPLIILHGLFGSSDNWHSHAKRFGEHFQVFTLDLRNHGRSPHIADLNYDVMRDDLLEFLDQQHLGSANLIGHSMGGKVAMHLALTAPERVQKLIVVDIASRAYPPAHEEIINTLQAIRLESFSSRTGVDEALAAGIPQVAIRQFLMKNLARTESGSFRWKMNLPVIIENYAAVNRAITSATVFPNPTLFLRGGKSAYVLDSDIPVIDTLFSQATVTTLPGAGHWVHAEAPEEFYDIALQFLESHSLR